MLEAPARGAARCASGRYSSRRIWNGQVTQQLGLQAAALLARKPLPSAALQRGCHWRDCRHDPVAKAFPSRCFSSDSQATEDGWIRHEAPSKESKDVVLTKRIPKDFVENTLRPHLESQLLDSIQAYTPAELAKIARAYARYEPRQYNLCVKLADTVMFRIDAFEAVDIIDLLSALWVLTPGYQRVWDALEKRIQEVLDQFTALNLMGIIRIFNKLSTKNHDFIATLLPRLRELLQDYEAVELHDMLVSMAQAEEARQDMDILLTLVPEVEQRYSELSLVHAINIVWALTQLKVIHPRLLKKVAEDINNPVKVKDITPAFMARITWVFRRCNHWDEVSETMLPLVKAAAPEFRCGEFARLAQALPEHRDLLQRIAGVLQPGLPEMGRQDFLLFLLGCVHGQLLEIDSKAAEQESSLTGMCLEYIREEQDNFQREEVEKVVYLLGFSPAYKHLIDSLPMSWKTTTDEVLDYIRAKS